MAIQIFPAVGSIPSSTLLLQWKYVNRSAHSDARVFNEGWRVDGFCRNGSEFHDH